MPNFQAHKILLYKNTLKFEKKIAFKYSREMSPKDADGMAISADPKSSPIWGCTLCSRLSLNRTM